MPHLFFQYILFMLTDFNDSFTITPAMYKTHLSPHLYCIAALPDKIIQ